MDPKQKHLVTAGGHITCVRCQAYSRHSKSQCNKPALRGKSVCAQHGGRSSGAKTEIGKEKARLARVKSGAYTKESRTRHSDTLLKLAMIEECGFALGLFVGERTKGRRPSGFKKITNPDQARETIRNIDSRTEGSNRS